MRSVSPRPMVPLSPPRTLAKLGDVLAVQQPAHFLDQSAQLLVIRHVFLAERVQELQQPIDADQLLAGGPSGLGVSLSTRASTSSLNVSRSPSRISSSISFHCTVALAWGVRGNEEV